MMANVVAEVGVIAAEPPTMATVVPLLRSAGTQVINKWLNPSALSRGGENGVLS
jgi:hypothetical protein